MQNTSLREYDKSLNDCYSEIAIESIDPIVILKLCVLEYLLRLSNQHKTKNHGECRKSAHAHGQLKKKHKGKCHNEEHHKMNPVNNQLKTKGNKNYNSEREIFNSFKIDSTENNNYIPLENNTKDKNSILLGNNEENKNHDLSKDEGLKIENFTNFKEMYNQNFLEENFDNIEENLDNIEENLDIIEKEELPPKIYSNQGDKVTIVNCKTTVTSEMLPLCENIPHSSEVTVAPVIVKIPVVLTECTVTITDTSSLKLEDIILEIKHIRKNVYLNQCKLIPHSENGKFNTGVLFIDGFIRKNIEYTTKEHDYKGILCGKVKHITVKVPFKCATRVTFKTQPRFKANISQDEVEILKTSMKVSEHCGEDIIGKDILEKNFKIVEFFNEKVYCELISAEIMESDILENSINEECKTPLEEGFHDITEKVVISLTIKLLQNQHVEIPKQLMIIKDNLNMNVF